MSISFDEREERPAYVRFEQRAVHDKAESLKQGKTIYKDVDWALVTPPYSRDVYEEKAESWLEKQKQNVRNGRIPQKFVEFWNESYRRWKDGQEAPLNGTDIRNWALITKAQVEMLRSVKIFTIEDLANCTDEGLSQIGYGGSDLRNKARAYVKGSSDSGSLAMENAAQKEQIKVLEGSIESLQDQIRRLSVKMESKDMGSDEIEFDDIIENDRDQLVREYKEKFGRMPHGKASIETLKAKLAEA